MVGGISEGGTFIGEYFHRGQFSGEQFSSGQFFRGQFSGGGGNFGGADKNKLLDEVSESDNIVTRPNGE